MKYWTLIKKNADFNGLSKELDIDPVAVRLMVNRGLESLEEMKDFLDEDISGSFLYEGLPYIEEAVETIKESKAAKLKCRIIGDYDADGVLATAILMKGLKAYGLDCDFAIPNRLTEGYGINVNIVDKAYEDKVGIIVTCDNGISAKEAIDKAFDYGMKVVVTDHHTLTEAMVPTKWNALVNPKCPNNKYPFADICGAMVAFKLLCALFENDDSFESLKYELLELAAIATDTDVMPLIKENRKAVKWLLYRLKNPTNKGLRALANKTGIAEKDGPSKTGDIGFKIGPCINATGRIDVADRAVKLFVSDDLKEIDLIATELVSINEERKIITEECFVEANEEIDRILSKKNGLDDIIVMYLPKCHMSICGLVAGRLKEKYYRPCIVLTDSPEGLTGSGRSIDEFNLIENIQKCSDLLSKFGGHKAACGMSLKKENLQAFKEKINDVSALTKEDLTEKLRIDADMPFSYVTDKTIDSIKRLEPFGTGNVTPVFALQSLKIVKGKKTGSEGQHLFLTVRDKQGKTRLLKYWRKCEEFEEFLLEKISLDCLDRFYSYDGIEDENLLITVSYMPDINEFNGFRNIEFTLKDYKYS